MFVWDRQVTEKRFIDENDKDKYLWHFFDENKNINRTNDIMFCGDKKSYVEGHILIMDNITHTTQITLTASKTVSIAGLLFRDRNAYCYFKNAIIKYQGKLWDEKNITTLSVFQHNNESC